MALLSVQNLLLSLLVIVPGFISTHVAVSLGVIREDLSKWRLLIVSLTLSLIVDTLFFTSVQVFAGPVSTPTDIWGIFFTPRFNPLPVALILGYSGGVGLIAGIALAANLHESVRQWIWTQVGSGPHRKPWEPWEMALDKANRIQLQLSDGAVVVGAPHHTSDDDKERQILLKNQEWNFQATDGFEKSEADAELLFEDDIMSISIIDSDEFET